MRSMQRIFRHAPDMDAIALHAHDPLTTRLLVNRGITDEAAAETFLRPRYEDMHDPFLMHDMEKAVVRLFEAVESKEQVVIYADYDCDGIPGAVILHDLLKKIGHENFFVYIPDRHIEGYGLNEAAITFCAERKASLLITVDLGTADREEVALAASRGIDVIVTDHHLPQEQVAAPYALVNPKLGNYPEPMLCGAGVAFKLVQAFLSKYGEYFSVRSGWEKWLLDMAALATFSDMVPLTGENRTIVYYGLQVLRKSPRAGLQQLLRKLRIDQRYLTEDDIAFMIAPRLNAASRMDSPMKAFELLVAADPVSAGMLAEHLSKINDERKKIVAHIMKGVKRTLSERVLGDVLVLGDPAWRVGLLGLVAGKVAEEYDRPVFVWGREGSASDAVLKGSCRSNGSVNVVRLMEDLAETFIDFGGHELAGGFSIATDEVHFLEEKLTEAYQRHRRQVEANETILDATLALSDVERLTIDRIERLGPFGIHNPKPLFIFPDVLVSEQRMFGKERNHLEVTLREEGGATATAIAFFTMPEAFSKPLQPGMRVDMVATIERSYFLGKQSIRLRIIDAC